MRESTTPSDGGAGEGADEGAGAVALANNDGEGADGRADDEGYGICRNRVKVIGGVEAVIGEVDIRGVDDSTEVEAVSTRVVDISTEVEVAGVEAAIGMRLQFKLFLFFFIGQLRPLLHLHYFHLHLQDRVEHFIKDVGLYDDKICQERSQTHQSLLDTLHGIMSTSQEVKDLLHVPFTSIKPKKIIDNDGNVDNDMVVYMENTLKIKLNDFKDQGKASKLLSICTTNGSPAPTVIGTPLDGNGLEANTLSSPNFEDSSKDEDGKLFYKSIKTINFFPFRIDEKGRNMEKELVAILEELPMSLSLNPSLMCIFLVVPYVSKCLSSHVFLEDSLLHSGSMLDPSRHDLGVMNNASNESIVVGFRLDGALFDIIHDKPKKIKDNDEHVDNGMVVYMESALKIKLEADGKPTSIIIDRPLDGNILEANTLPHSKQGANKRIINLNLQEICIISIMVVAVELMLLIGTTMEMETSLLTDIMDLDSAPELVVSLVQKAAVASAEIEATAVEIEAAEEEFQEQQKNSIRQKL
ncbi:hypothetical protein M9H77_17328 [Catharanthus roseus]|uniref:Uncharacterized protein n=1 Tax=Catharanthus roseus TaxID=4058 RepID=A0ACC0B492_CATRO|nr:hypothetical protein M9H77_17328 [Catharanthus roseus]